MNRGSQKQNKQQQTQNRYGEKTNKQKNTVKGGGEAWVVKQKESRNKERENEEFTYLAAKIAVVARQR